MTVRLMLELEEPLEELVGLAIKHGFMREEPKRAWTDAERKEAVRYYIKRLIDKDKGR